MEFITTIGNPWSLIIILVILLVISYLIKASNSKNIKVSTPFFNYEQSGAQSDTSNNNNQNFDLKNVSLDKIIEIQNRNMEEITKLKSVISNLKKTLKYLELKDKLKFDYRTRINKIVKEFYVTTVEKFEKHLSEFLTKETNGQFDPEKIRYTDEYIINLYLFNDIKNTIIKKFMDDFDMNNFSSIGVDSAGQFDQKTYYEYLNKKPPEFETEVKNIFLTLRDQPLTLFESEGGKLILEPRKILVPKTEIYNVVLNNLKIFSNDIRSVYEWIIDRYKKINQDYVSFNEGLENEKSF